MFGQVIMGSPGSGKSTYCKAVQKYLKENGRTVEIINLDPGNDELQYDCSIDVCDLINVWDVMEHEKLGPNGAMIFSMEHLETNIQWLINKMSKKPKNSYFLFDCPGQIELYTHNQAVQNILKLLIKTLKLNLVSIFLLDSVHICDSNTFISLLMTTLLFMLRIELPSIAALGKSDLINHDDLPFDIEYFTQVQDLNYLLKFDEEKKSKEHQKLQEGLIDIVERYGLVSFRLLNVMDDQLLAGVVKEADRLCLYKSIKKS